MSEDTEPWLSEPSAPEDQPEPEPYAFDDVKIEEPQPPNPEEGNVLSWHQLIAEEDKNNNRTGSASSAATFGTVGRDLWAKLDAFTGEESGRGLAAETIPENEQEPVVVQAPEGKKKGGKPTTVKTKGGVGKKKKLAPSNPPVTKSKLRKPMVKVPTQARLQKEELEVLPVEKKQTSEAQSTNDGEPDLSALMENSKAPDDKLKPKGKGVSLHRELADLKRKYHQEVLERSRLEKILKEIQASGNLPVGENGEPAPSSSLPQGTLPLLAMAALNSTSLDQAENMRNHYEKRLDMERRKLARALEDNKILSSRLKETDIVANKKMHLQQIQLKRSNVVNNLRKTIKQLNTEKKHLQDTIAEYERRLQADQRDIERMKRELESVAARLMRSQVQREMKNNDYESNLREAERELELERKTRAKLEAKLDALKARAAVGEINQNTFDAITETLDKSPIAINVVDGTTTAEPAVVEESHQATQGPSGESEELSRTKLPPVFTSKKGKKKRPKRKTTEDAAVSNTLDTFSQSVDEPVKEPDQNDSGRLDDYFEFQGSSDERRPRTVDYLPPITNDRQTSSRRKDPTDDYERASLSGALEVPEPPKVDFGFLGSIANLPPPPGFHYDSQADLKVGELLEDTDKLLMGISIPAKNEQSEGSINARFDTASISAPKTAHSTRSSKLGVQPPQTSSYDDDEIVTSKPFKLGSGKSRTQELVDDHEAKINYSNGNLSMKTQKTDMKASDGNSTTFSKGANKSVFSKNSFGNLSQFAGGASYGNLSTRSSQFRNSLGNLSTTKTVKLQAEDGHDAEDRASDFKPKKRKASRKNSTKDDALKAAKVHLEYDAWVNKKDSPLHSIGTLNSKEGGNVEQTRISSAAENFYDQDFA